MPSSDAPEVTTERVKQVLNGSPASQADELSSAFRTLAPAADECDHRLVEEAGARRMQDPLDDTATCASLSDIGGRSGWDD